METFKAVVETGSCSIGPEPRRWEERFTCGHAHRTARAAYECLDRLHARHRELNKLVESAKWYDGRVHDSGHRRVGCPDE